ncbi:MAG: hypothetical protein R2784_20285 [Saprospiraceae bacterium]
MEKQPDKKNSFKNLPEYKAPDRIWENIQNELDKPEEMVPLKDLLSKLPTLEAPDSLWAQIEKDLDGPSKNENGLKVFMSRPWVSIAASLILLIGFLAWFINQPSASGPEIELVQYEEVIQEDWQFEDEGDEAAFALVDQFCKEKHFVCNQPEFQNLKSELDELNLACDAMKEVIGNYNDAPEMIAQLTEIEMERTEVLKKIMAYL